MRECVRVLILICVCTIAFIIGNGGKWMFCASLQMPLSLCLPHSPPVSVVTVFPVHPISENVSGFYVSFDYNFLCLSLRLLLSAITQNAFFFICMCCLSLPPLIIDCITSNIFIRTQQITATTTNNGENKKIKKNASTKTSFIFMVCEKKKQKMFRISPQMMM